MKFLSHLLLISTVGLQHALARTASAAKEEPMLPIYDPFYVPPTEVDGVPWNESARGTILNRREVNISTVIFPGKSKATAYQLLYHTRDVHNNSDASVTTIIVPAKPIMNRVISLQNAYDSPDVNCNPSYGLQYGAKGWSAQWNKVNLLFIMPYLQEGPILNIPDYEGSNAAFGVGPQSAYQTLDSIRAAMASTDYTGIEEEAKVIMFGYSGGALATEWATEFKSSYANDLPIIGAVMGGPPTNISQTYLNVNGEKLAGLDVWAVLGIMNAYPEMNQWMRDDLRTDEYQDKKFLLELSSCSYEGKLAEDTDFTNISSWFKSGDHFLERYKDLIKEIGWMGQGLTEESNPGYPLYIFYGTKDEVTAPLGATQDLIKRWKKEGKATVWDVPLLGFDHMSAVLPGVALAIPWINTRFKNVEDGVKDDMYPEGMIFGGLEGSQQVSIDASMSDFYRQSGKVDL
ncbi:hypothetical protein N7478_012473 [Penicillium angulare]|uniref:uncharacterized protein n=1 Tax=Penicillium angulare TaxID=116970 RepID=UPI00254024D2|nr:uncharacterized protein N7478_012473 [Penicillium angulare]KAJ5259492.1 hypothetical protein N7478_012473 [Penicillium angulare]